MAIYQLDQSIPEIDPDAWVADNATVVGRVRLAARSSVWFGATLRGDNDLISIGAGSNVQDGAVLHTDPGHPLTVGESVTIGHQAMLHGCTIGERSLVGLHAVVLNGARIGRECLIGAGSLVPEGKVFPDRCLLVGTPAKVVRELSDEEVAAFQRGVQSYVERARLFRSKLVRIA
ncbi:MAG: gamma carbonic anhydrase family protein [Burkholderiales bacterium]|jgi:carbonic anhydrase/acetyltransferase-like protein (isoleucine patch superfamily)|nr:gamma carbonic anhydrase family protein [Burkholderiales bacterium]